MGFYDKKVKTTYVECPRLVIMMINSVFNKNHKQDSEVTFLDKEQIGEEDTTFMDMLIAIEECKYHLEFQLLEGNMAIRMYEYGVKETLKMVAQTNDDSLDQYHLEVIMPEQVVIFLAGNNKKGEITVHMVLPDKQEVTYRLPCVSASQSVEELVKKELYLLLPFQQVQLNDAMNHITNRSDEYKHKIANDLYSYRKLVKAELEKLREDGILKVSELESLITAFSDIEKYLTEKDSKVSEEVSLMGDKDYVPWSERLRAEGKAEGKAEGEELGSAKKLIEQICKKIDKGNSLEQIAEALEEDVTAIKPIYDAAVKQKPNYDIDGILKEIKK